MLAFGFTKVNETNFLLLYYIPRPLISEIVLSIALLINSISYDPVTKHRDYARHMSIA